jgi:hypothetical protein
VRLKNSSGVSIFICNEKIKNDRHCVYILKAKKLLQHKVILSSRNHMTHSPSVQDVSIIQPIHGLASCNNILYYRTEGVVHRNQLCKYIT